MNQYVYFLIERSLLLYNNPHDYMDSSTTNYEFHELLYGKDKSVLLNRINTIHETLSGGILYTNCDEVFEKICKDTKAIMLEFKVPEELLSKNENDESEQVSHKSDNDSSINPAAFNMKGTSYGQLLAPENFTGIAYKPDKNATCIRFIGAEAFVASIENEKKLGQHTSVLYGNSRNNNQPATTVIDNVSCKCSIL